MNANQRRWTETTVKEIMESNLTDLDKAIEIVKQIDTTEPAAVVIALEQAMKGARK